MVYKNAWKKYQDNEKMNELMKFNDEYIDFLSNNKTEREITNYSIKIAEKNGFKDISKFKSLKKGDKVYVTNKNKNILLFVIGEKKLTEGLNILGAHIDSPRIDIKENPLYEAGEMALLDTHYYGGIIKYQWVARMMSIHGVVCLKNGKTVDVVIGEDENDPVFTITDLLIHLSADKLEKPARLAVEGEKLDLTFGSIPEFKDKDKKSIKNNVLLLLKNKYGISEEDFISAELEIVPQGKARSLGIDSSMVIGYGHDDKVCAYTSLRAILDETNLERTSCAYLVDKEEVGSIGATGAQSEFFKNALAELILLQEGNYNELYLKRALTNSYMLSSDVSAGYDPLYPEAFEEKNAAFLGKGITFNKYTGARGKSGCNDANPEFIAKIRKVLDDEKIYFQTAELGKVDRGGGGTIAYIMGNMNMNVIDAGIPVLSMHAPCEVVSKVDVYEAYLAYKAFIKNIK